MLTLIGMGSPNVVKVVLMLEEVGLPYRIERCDVILGSARDPAFRVLSPSGKVPVLIDEDGPDGRLVIAESGAILIHLAERTGRFLPAGGAARYAVLQWLMVQMSAIGPVFGHAIHLQSFARQERYATTRFRNEARRLVTVLDERLATAPFLGGDDYSIADIATYPWIRTASRFFPDLLPSAKMQPWLDAIAARPTAVRTGRIADELAALDRASFKAASPEQLDRYFGR